MIIFAVFKSYMCNFWFLNYRVMVRLSPTLVKFLFIANFGNIDIWYLDIY